LFSSWRCFDNTGDLRKEKWDLRRLRQARFAPEADRSRSREEQGS
jgi:hypothetical protein